MSRSLSMDEFKHVFQMGLDSRGRRFVTEMDGPRRISTAKPDSEFYVHGRPVDLRYIRDAINAVGMEKFKKINPWFVARFKPLRTPAMDLADEAMKEHEEAEKQWFKVMIDDLGEMGWGSEDINKFFIGAARRIRRKIAEDKLPASDSMNLEIDPAHVLNEMFKFGKKEHPQLWKKDKKKVTT